MSPGRVSGGLSLSLTLLLVLSLLACKRSTSFDESLHEAPLAARVVKTTPPVSIEVPPELTEGSFGGDVQLEGPKGKQAQLSITLSTRADLPGSKEEARSKAGDIGREINAFETPDALGILWEPGSAPSDVRGSIHRKLPGQNVYCGGHIRYLSPPDEKVRDDHAMFLRKVCESIRLAN